MSNVKEAVASVKKVLSNPDVQAVALGATIAVAWKSRGTILRVAKNGLAKPAAADVPDTI